MKRFAIVALLVFVGFAGWRVGGVLSTDAMSMAVGIVLGVLAGVPTALLILVATRRHAQAESLTSSRSQQTTSSGQLPIVVLAPPAYAPAGTQFGGEYPQLTGRQADNWAHVSQPARPERAFTIVGEQANMVDF